MPKKLQQRKSQHKRPSVTAAQAAPVAAATHKSWQIAAVCLILAVATVFAYRGARSNDFVTYDDLSYVLENPQIQQGLNLHSIDWAFTTCYASNWHPLTWISHMVDWGLYGKDPAGHHITNVCLHAANSVLLFLLLFYMTGLPGRSAMVAFLFALHPAHVESVAWISERKDVLCAFFWFATLLAYAWHRRQPSWKRYAWVVCGFACALMSKPMAVTLPLTLLLLDYWPLHRIAFTPETRSQWFSSLWKLCLEKSPLFIMAAISSVITFFAQRAGGMVVELQTLPLWERISNAAVSYLRYLRILFWPNPLTAYYYEERNHIAITAAVLSVVALVLVTALCWHFRKERPYCFAGWLWFLATLVPVIGIVQVGDQALAERYIYVPSIGIFIAIVWLAGDAVAKFPRIRIAAQLLAVAVLAACAIKTQAQVKVWKNSVTLFSHVLQIDPRGGPPNIGLGLAYERQGNTIEAQQYFDRALVYYPSWPLALSCSAFCLMNNGLHAHDMSNLPLAGQRLEKALSIAPDEPNVLANMALWSSLMGRPKDEETYSSKAIAAQPDLIQARFYLAEALMAQGKLDQAAGENRQILAIDPNNFAAHNNLGMIFENRGMMQDALKQYRLSLAIKPDQAMPHARIARIMAQMHRLPDAVDEFNQALRIEPANPYTHNDLGVVFFQMGDYQKAAQQFSSAAQIDPAYADARRNIALAQAHIKTGK